MIALSALSGSAMAVARFVTWGNVGVAVVLLAGITLWQVCCARDEEQHTG